MFGKSNGTGTSPIESVKSSYSRTYKSHLQTGMLHQFPHFGLIMEPMDITFLNHLDVSHDNYTLKVRIIKLWRQPSFKVPGETYAIEMILMDEEGNKIQATVMNKYFVKFEKLLEESVCLLIKKPSLGDNTSSYKCVDHPHKLFLNFDSTVKKCNDFLGPIHGFSFTAFDQLRGNLIPDDSTVDLIGYVHTFFEIEEFKRKNGKLSKKMNLQLHDLEARNIFVTLFDSYAEKMWNYLSKKEDGVLAVIILQFGRYKFLRGRAYVSTFYSASSLYIDDDIDEITVFKKNFINSLLAKEGDETASSHRVTSSLMLPNWRDDFLTKTVYHTMAEVNEIDQVTTVIVVGTIKCITQGIEWFYNACKKCNKKVITKHIASEIPDGSDQFEEKQILECTNQSCNEHVVFAIPRFKIPLRVQDKTGVLSLTLFDRDAQKILKKSAKELVDKILDGETNIFPNEFKDLVDKKFAFKIDIANFNLKNNYKFFTVIKLTDDPAIISDLEKKYKVEQPSSLESFDVHCTDSQSQDMVNIKDSISGTGENETPLSVSDISTGRTLLQNESTKKTNIYGELKRNLVEVYDLDESPGRSATKPRQDPTEGLKGVSEPTLLVPKIEK
ncbi:replication protein A 70 kDa DNA-binding subunit D isoform X2 [Helianthus annuus]|uniref:replication protein A 70 kDa DNA-binding subunit D isoform X2 n=1 Tax=Helianthus annuus TaxID=4232 RepID=UPI000B8FF96D|nr:replication protein A 70 kDa DNA-binding subunit D isoform X2 [Helianthus annuus]